MTSVAFDLVCDWLLRFRPISDPSVAALYNERCSIGAALKKLTGIQCRTWSGITIAAGCNRDKIAPLYTNGLQMTRYLSARGFNAALVAIMLCVPPLAVRAAPISGELDLQSGGISLSSTGIDFTSVLATGIFSGLNGTAITTADVPAGAPVNPTFITFDAAPAFSIASTSVSPGVFTSANCGAAPAIGQTCTPPGSPLNLVNTYNGVTASFTVQGTLISPTGAPTPITGVYTLQFADTNYQTLLATLAAGGTVTTTYSAEFLSSATSGDRLRFGGTVGVSSTTLDFSAKAIIGSAGGGFTVANTSTGTFSGLVGTSGTTIDLVGPPVGAVNIPNFLTLAADPALHGGLDFIWPGLFSAAQCAAAPALAQTCALPNSPLSFTNIAGGSIASFDIAGFFADLSDSAAYKGLFSIQFAGLSYQQVLALISSGGSVAGIYSASFDAGAPTPTIPEPASVWLLMLALSALFIVAHRRKRAEDARMR
jgi:hypothetical protein